MKPAMIVTIATLCGIAGFAVGDELKIEFPDKSVQGAFGDQNPLRVGAIRKDGKIEVRLENVSPKHVVVTKHHHTWGGHYEAPDGSKLEEFGMTVPGTPKEFFDHVVLAPNTQRKGASALSSLTFIRIPDSHEVGSTYVFNSVLSGYFPTIDKYVTFTVRGRLAIQLGKSQDTKKPKKEEKPRSQ